MSAAEDAMYAANHAVRAYDGPIKTPDGQTHPEWARLLEAARILRSEAERSHKQRCPTCGRK